MIKSENDGDESQLGDIVVAGLTAVDGVIELVPEWLVVSAAVTTNDDTY